MSPGKVIAGRKPVLKLRFGLRRCRRCPDDAERSVAHSDAAIGATRAGEELQGRIRVGGRALDQYARIARAQSIDLSGGNDVPLLHVKELVVPLVVFPPLPGGPSATEWIYSVLAVYEITAESRLCIRNGVVDAAQKIIFHRGVVGHDRGLPCAGIYVLSVHKGERRFYVERGRRVKRQHGVDRRRRRGIRGR